MQTYAPRVVLLSLLLITLSSASAQRISLDGEWIFRADSARVGLGERWFSPSSDRSGWKPVRTPAFWESYPGLAAYNGWGWFVRTVEITNPSKPLSLHFAGVDDDAMVWVNGVEVGSHTGYSDPFAVELGQAVRPGNNLIAVLVKDYAGGGGIYRPVTLIPTAHLDDMLKGPYYGMPALKSADWVRNAVIYSVYLRSFSQEGTFAGLERRIPELKRLGVTVLWLMPIHPIGELRRKGSLGSPYSVRDYYEVNPEFGTLEDFKHLLETAHQNGLKLIIDLVANHTSWDSRLINEHPEWFSRNASGDIIPPNDDWTDVADLDYSHRGLRAYMITMMEWWVRTVGIDGFRCDVAELVPTDFWEEARAALNQIKPVMMLSEGSLPEHHLKAFDLTYSWNIYDALEPLLTGRRPVGLIDQILRNESYQFPVGALRMRFTTNHDKNAWDAPAVEKFGLAGLKLATVLVNTVPGVPMIYTAEEVANNRKLSLFEKVAVDWKRADEVGRLNRTLFRLRKNHPALVRGELLRVGAPETPGVYAFLRQFKNDRVLVILNFGSGETRFRATIPWGKVARKQGKPALREVFSGTRVPLSLDSPGVDLTLDAKGFRVFVVE